ncbi:hypothetical protein MLD38_038235 [Melastoma candidum]|uniref:Uncharacterized protein n=1 Tax=Melastoma candidum TaxID=119954 RepID=A0ACB9KYZ4_9MYRT|nr:hypothetical protein MLD38_038235 [Melastoma candidum]
MMEEKKKRCVECGSHVESLYVQYSPGNIRLMKCERCKAVADGYIECEHMILLIDLILHKPQAYRHLLFNLLDQPTVDSKGLLWKSALIYLALDAYRFIFLQLARQGWPSSSSGGFSSILLFSGKMIFDIFLGNFLLFAVFLVMTSGEDNVSRLKDRSLVSSILISSYFKFFLLVTLVWEFPSSVIYVIDLFVLSSNAMVLKVLTKSTSERCIWTCVAAHATRLLAAELSGWCFGHG